jgi:hypothetical protein
VELFQGQFNPNSVPLEHAIGLVAVDAKGFGKLMMGYLLFAIEVDKEQFLGRLIQVGSSRPKLLFNVLRYLEADSHAFISASSEFQQVAHMPRAL